MANATQMSAGLKRWICSIQTSHFVSAGGFFFSLKIIVTVLDGRKALAMAGTPAEKPPSCVAHVGAHVRRCMHILYIPRIAVAIAMRATAPARWPPGGHMRTEHHTQKKRCFPSPRLRSRLGRGAGASASLVGTLPRSKPLRCVSQPGPAP